MPSTSRKGELEKHKAKMWKDRQQRHKEGE